MLEQNQQLNNSVTESEESSFNLKEFLQRYIKYIPLVILFIVLAYFAAKLNLRYTYNVYSASGTMIIKDDKGKSDFGDGKAVEDLFTNKSGNDLETEIELMRSRLLMKRVVKKLGLQNSYYAKGKVKVSVQYQTNQIQVSPAIEGDSLDGLSFEIKVISASNFEIKNEKSQYTFGIPFVILGKKIVVNKTSSFVYPLSNDRIIYSTQTNISLADSYRENLKVAQVERTRLVNVSIKGDDANKCKDIVNELMAEYINQNQEDAKQTSDYTKKFIDDRVNELSLNLKDIEGATRKFREIKGTVNIDAQSAIYLTDATNAKKEYLKQKVQAELANEILSEFEKDVEVKNTAPTGIVDDANLQNLFLIYNERQFARQRLLKDVATVNDFVYVEKTNDAKNFRLAIIGGLKKLVTIANESAAAAQKIVDENVAKLKDVPGLQNELYNFSRNQKIVEELYLFLKKKSEENGISAASKVSNARVIDEALKNEKPVSPVPSKVYAIALFIGLLIPIALIYVVELFNDKIRYRTDIEKITKTPILAEVGHNDEGRTLVVTAKSRKVITEQFRMIRTNLQYLVGSVEKSTILVTSSFSGEGKSFISTNVAAAIALTGKRTVLLEFDLRKPKVLEGLNIQKSVGISNYVVGKSTITEILKPIDGYDNLYVIGCGAIPPNPAELLLNGKIDELFAYLKKNFDAIIIDSAPVGLVTDSMTLSKFADATLYIVRHKYTLKKQINFVNELYVNNKLPKLSIIINDVVGGTGGYYGYGGYGYGGYGYGSGKAYGSGYFETPTRNRLKNIWAGIKDFLLFWK